LLGVRTITLKVLTALEVDRPATAAAVEKLAKWLSRSFAPYRICTSVIRGILATGRRAAEAVAFAVDFSPARGDSPFNLNRA
jgi:hypothetical protein